MRHGVVIQRRYVVFVILLAVVVLLYFGRSKTHRSMSYSYPIQVQVPEDVDVKSIGYFSTFQRGQIEDCLSHHGSGDFSFEPVSSPRFDASVSGHWNSSWFGLVHDKGREDVILVRVETVHGKVLLGMADLPAEEGPVEVFVE